MQREAKVERITKETDISIEIKIDGGGDYNISSGIGFFDHMLEQIAKHGFFDIQLLAKGDLQVDYHHTVEDVGIAIGMAIREALGDRRGIKRYSTQFTPMDEALAMVAIDISGRPFLHYEVVCSGERVGGFELQLVEEFFRAVAFNSGITLHIRSIYGRNNHHIIESIFKAFGRALDEATGQDSRINGVLSTKGAL